MSARGRLLALAAIALLALFAWRLRSRGTPAAISSPEAAAPRRAAAPRAGTTAPPIRLSDGRVAVEGATPGAFTLTGRVVSTVDHSAIGGAVVTLGGPTSVEVKGGADGRFAWTTETPGGYEIVAIAAAGFAPFAAEPGHGALVVHARAGVRIEGVTLYLAPATGAAARADLGDAGPRDGGAPIDGGAAPAGGRLVGTVREAETARAIAAFTVLALVRKGAIERGEARHASFFDGDGRFELGEVEPGTQCVSAIAVGRAAAPEQCVEVRAGGEARVDFQLTRGGRLGGRVIDGPTRAPIAGAQVSMERPFAVDDGPVPVALATETDALGRFQLDGLDTGVRSIFVSAAGHHSRVLPGIRLDADRASPSLEVDLTPTGPGEAPRIESAGINAVVRADGDELVLGRLTPTGGAAQAGLREGDVVVRVDGEDLAALGMQGGVERLRGPEGSRVTLTVRRPAEGKTFDVVVTRRRVINY